MSQKKWHKLRNEPTPHFLPLCACLSSLLTSIQWMFPRLWLVQWLLGNNPSSMPQWLISPLLFCLPDVCLKGLPKCLWLAWKPGNNPSWMADCLISSSNCQNACLLPVCNLPKYLATSLPECQIAWFPCLLQAARPNGWFPPLLAKITCLLPACLLPSPNGWYPATNQLYFSPSILRSLYMLSAA